MKPTSMLSCIALGLAAVPHFANGGLIHNETKLWPATFDRITRIQVCTFGTGFPAERAVILSAIVNSWQRVAMVNFIDKGDCAGVPQPRVSIRIISVTSNQSDAQATGTGVGERQVVFWLPATMQFDRLRYLAIHEFGHILGFQHEQDSPLRDVGCSTSQAWGNVSQLGGVWDRQSVMNSGCNAFGNNVGYLSPGDVDSVRILYGLRRVRTYGDFDGNGGTDWATWHMTQGWVYDNTAAPHAKQWGVAGDRIVPGDYDGNERTDRAVWRPTSGEWWIDLPGYPSRVWGRNGDIPVQEDYNGDGRTDRAIFRPSTSEWWIDVPGQPQGLRFGNPGDIPVPADYDGDGRAEIAVWTPSTGQWRIRSNNAELQGGLGQAGDIPIPGDYVGEGRARAAVYQPSTGCFLLSMRPPFAPNTTICIPGAQAGDIPVKGRYSGQFHEEPVVFRPAAGQFITRTGAFRDRGPANSVPAF